MNVPDNQKFDYRSITERLTASLKASGLINDTNEGSVTQILAETFAYEMAVFYAILEKVHDAGYLDTASGSALDKVVAILGITRKKPGILQGEVVFSRSVPANKDIVIPAGVKLTGGDDTPVMETIEQARIPLGELSAVIPVQEKIDDGTEDNMKRSNLPPESVTIMVRPLLGIEKVSNPSPMIRSGKAESDDALRTRARAVLRENQTCTPEAIRAAIHSHGIKSVKILEPPDIPLGCLEVHLGDHELKTNKKLVKIVEDTIRMAKPAGIHLSIKYLKQVFCQIEIKAMTENPDMGDEDFALQTDKIKQDITQFINNLAAGKSIMKSRLNALLAINDTIRSPELHFETIVINSDNEPAIDTGTRELPDGWYIDPLENAVVDQRWPITIIRKEYLKARMEFAVTVANMVLDPEVTKAYLRTAAEKYIQKHTRLIFQDLKQDLNKTVEIVSLQSVYITHLADGKIESLTKDHEVVLGDDEELTISLIEVVVSNNG